MCPPGTDCRSSVMGEQLSGGLRPPKVISDFSKVVFWMKPGAFPSAWGGDLTLSLLC